MLKRKGRLVLSRDINEEILIGNDIRVTIVAIRGTRSRVLIEAPLEVRVLRGESARQVAIELATIQTPATK